MTGYREQLRELAAHVCVVTARDPHGLERGLTVTTAVSVGVEPEELLVCLSRAASTTWAVRAARAFTVNLLGSGHERLARVFAGEADVVGGQRFELGTWLRGSAGPVLADAPAAFECRVERIVERSTHDVVFGAVTGVHGAGGPPLLYRRQGYRRLDGAG